MSTRRPATDELEVSVFGPGLGECIVVHLGEDEWLVVDSCRDPDSRRPAALQYLERLGVDVASRVKLVVVTHWHDDHMLGAAEVFRSALESRFCCSTALRRDEFWTLVASRDQLVMKGSATGIDEFAAILETLEARRAPGVRAASVGPGWAMADRTLYRREAGEHAPACEVQALSPSDAASTRAFRGLAELMPAIGQPKRAAVSVAPNEASVVLLVSLGTTQALLGADLETGSNPTSGWHAIVASTTRSTSEAKIFKVAYHGSPNADHDGIWTTLLDGEPVAVLTPFLRGGVVRPTAADLERIRTRTPHAYSAGRPRPGAPIPRHKAVERTLRERSIVVRPRTGRLGHVRVRQRDGEEPVVEMFGDAFAL